MLKTIVGMFLDTADARRAVYDLRDARFPEADISVAMRERYDSTLATGAGLLDLPMGNQASTTPMDQGRMAAEGLYPATDTDAPGFGPIVAAGLLAQGLGGAALGVAAGGLVGALSDVGIPNDTARELIDRVRAGRQTLVCIQVDREDVDRVEKMLVDNGADEVYRGTDHTGHYDQGGRAARAAEQGL